MLQTLIIGEEAHIRDTMSKMLARFCPRVKLAGEASCVADGIKAISKLHPDLVFLDMSLVDENAFALLHKGKCFDFKVVFISTSDKETKQAIRLSGFEYLKKPFNQLELIEVVKRMEKKDASNLALQLDALEENLKFPEKK